MNDNIALGNKLKQLRASKGLTQKQAADHLGITSNAYQSFEYGKIRPSQRNLLKLAQLYSVTTDYLLTDIDMSVTPFPVSVNISSGHGSVSETALPYRQQAEDAVVKDSSLSGKAKASILEHIRIARILDKSNGWDK
jgi:transcriptional regulator with XRE-family HTH domain